MNRSWAQGTPDQATAKAANSPGQYNTCSAFACARPLQNQLGTDTATGARIWQEAADICGTPIQQQIQIRTGNPAQQQISNVTSSIVGSVRCVTFFILSFSFTGMTQLPFSGTANPRFVFTTSSSFFLMSQGPRRRQLHLCSLSELCVPLKSMSAAGVEGEILGLNFTIIYKYTGPSDNLRGIFGFLPWSYLAYHGRRKWGI